MALPTSTGSISTYRNKQRACCQSRTASSYLHTVRMSIFLGFSSNSCTAFTGDLLVTWTLRSIAVGMSQRHALSDGSGCEGVTEVMEPHIPRIPCTSISETLQFSYFCYPRFSIPLQNFRRLERRKPGKIAPKRYSCHRDSVSRAVADRRAYFSPKCNHRSGEAVLASCERMEVPSCKAQSSITAMVTSISKGLSRMALIATRHASLSG